MEKQANQAKEKDLEVHPRHEHRKRIIEEDADLKKNSVVVEEFIQIIGDQKHKSGGKVRKCSRMKNGNLHRIYLGRQKHLKEQLDLWKKQGMKIIVE